MKINGLKFLFLIVVVLAGCGNQDRYEVVAPEIGSTVETGVWGTVTSVSTVHNYFDEVRTAMVDGLQYFGSGEGLVYLVTGAGYEAIPRCEDFYVGDLLQGPDGLLWMTDYSGSVFYFQDGQWVLDQHLAIPWDSDTRLMLDNHNRILLYGNSYGFWRRDDSGQWTQQIIPAEAEIIHGWCEHGLSPVFLTTDLRMLTDGLGIWQLSEPIVEDIDSWRLEFQGNQDGRMAILIRDNREFLLNEGDGWKTIEGDNYLRHLFWMNNELYAVKKYRKEILRWGGTDWVTVCDVGDYSTSKVSSFAHGSGRVLNFSRGESWFFDGVSAVRKTKKLGWPTAFVRHEGVDHMFMNSEVHIQRIDGIWEEVGEPYDDSNRSSDTSRMFVDDEGYLTFIDSSRFIRWNGSTYSEFPAGASIYRSFIQNDGKAVVFSNDQVGVWSQGEVRWLGYFEGNTGSIRGAKLEPDDNVLVLFGTHLLQFSPEQSTITLTFQGWTPDVAAEGPGRKMACAGIERVVVLDGESVRDITPIWGGASGQAGRISTMISHGADGWLAYDYDRYALLNFDGQKWLDLGRSFDSSSDEAMLLNSNGDGTFMMWNYGNVYLIEPGVE